MVSAIASPRRVVPAAAAAAAPGVTAAAPVVAAAAAAPVQMPNMGVSGVVSSRLGRTTAVGVGELKLLPDGDLGMKRKELCVHCVAYTHAT